MMNEMTVTAKFDATMELLEKAFVEVANPALFEVDGFDYSDMMEFLADRRAKSVRKSTARKVDPAKEEFYALVADALSNAGVVTSKELTEFMVENGVDTTAAKVRGALTVLVKRGNAVKVAAEDEGKKSPVQYKVA